MEDLRSSYQTLGIAPGATLEQAVTAWQVLAGPLQPERLVGIDPDLKAEAEQHLVTLNEAWFVVHAHITTGAMPTPLTSPSPPAAQAPPPTTPSPPTRGPDASRPLDVDASYRLLGVSPGATQEQLTVAWSLIAGPLQSEQIIGAGSAARTRAELELAEMTEAWNTIQAHIAATSDAAPIESPADPQTWGTAPGAAMDLPLPPVPGTESHATWEAPTASSPFTGGSNQTWGGPTGGQTPPAWGAAPGFAHDPAPPGHRDPGQAWINAPGHQLAANTSQKRTIAYSVAFAVVSAVLILGLIAYRHNQTQGDYPQAMQDEFMSSCTGGALSSTQCRCLLDTFIEDVPYDRYREMDAQLTADPSDLPPELLAAVGKCR